MLLLVHWVWATSVTSLVGLLLLRARLLLRTRGWPSCSSVPSFVDGNLLRSSAVLFRGTGIENAQGFKEFIQGLGYETMGYEGGSGNRSQVDAEVFTSTDDPPEHNIELHSEMACTPYYTKKVR